MLERVTMWVLRHRRIVASVWVLVLCAGLLAGLRINTHLTAVTDVPGSPSAVANANVYRTFGENTEGSFIVFYEFTQADEAQIAAMKRQVEAAASRIPTAVVQQQRAIGGVLYASIGTSLPLLKASEQTPLLRKALVEAGLATARVTGPPALEHDVRPLLAEDLRRGGLLGSVLAIGVLLFAFGFSRRIVIPLAVAAATVTGSMCVVYLLSLKFTMVLYVPNIVELVGLGLALDYSLLLVHRHQQALEDPQSIIATMRTSGRTVLWAGVTAAIGLAALVLIPIPLVRSLGVAGLVVPLVGMCATLTLTPVLLALLGGGPMRGFLATRSTVFWERLGGTVTTHPRRTLAAALVGCFVLASPLAAVELAPASLTALPDEAPAAQAVAFLAKRLGPGVVTPQEVVIRVPEGTALNAMNDTARTRLADHLSDLPEVFGVFSEKTQGYVDASNTYQRIFVIGRHAFSDPRTMQLVGELRTLDPMSFGYASGSSIEIAGAPGQGADFLAMLRSAMPWVALLILIVAGFALARVFGSWRVAGVSVMLNLVSLAAACGVVVAVFQLGWGSLLLHTPAVPQIESWTFVFMFALLFGLTMDYQVFVVRRMMEARGSSVDLVEAIRVGLARTGGLITIAALAFVFALSGLVFGRLAGLQQLGVGLAAGVLIDATIVRGVLLPSAMTLLRRL